MTLSSVAEALPRAIRLIGWPKLAIFFFFSSMDVPGYENPDKLMNMLVGQVCRG